MAASAGFCTSCGRPIGVTDSFCAACGAQARRPDAVAPGHTDTSSGDVPKRRNKTLLLAVLAIAAIGGGIGLWAVLNGEDDGSAAAESPSAPRQLTAVVTIASDRDFEALGYEPLSWSPDGEFVFASAEDQVCVLSTRGSDDICFAWQGTADGPSWDSDSARVAFTENWYHGAQEADIWVIDTTDRSLTNWTQDDSAAFDREGDAPYADFYPVWLGDEVVFLRHTVETRSWSLERIGGPVGTQGTVVSCLLPEAAQFWLGGPILAGSGSVGISLVVDGSAWFVACEPNGASRRVSLEEDAVRGLPGVAGVLPGGRLVLYYARWVAGGQAERNLRSAMDIVLPDGTGRVEILEPLAESAQAKGGRDAILLLVDGTGTTAAVVTNIGGPEGFGEVSFTTTIHVADLDTLSDLDPFDDPPAWQQPARFKHPFGRGLVGGQYVVATLEPGDGVVAFQELTGDATPAYYRITLEEQ